MSALPAPRAGNEVAGAPRGRAVDIADALTSRQWDELTDRVIRRMELTIADELARRGRRVKPRGF